MIVHESQAQALQRAGELYFLDHGAEWATEAGVPAERIVTTWPVERLLAWSHAKR